MVNFDKLIKKTCPLCGAWGLDDAETLKDRKPVIEELGDGKYKCLICKRVWGRMTEEDGDTSEVED